MYEKALGVMSVSTIDEVIEERLKELEVRGNKLNQLMSAVRDKILQITDLVELNSLTTNPELSNEFWKKIKEVGERNYEETPSDNDGENPIPF